MCWFQIVVAEKLIIILGGERVNPQQVMQEEDLQIHKEYFFKSIRMH